LLLVENGWTSVIRHRKDDEDRSPIYDELLAAEEAYVFIISQARNLLFNTNRFP
jgi:hypothetical protein